MDCDQGGGKEAVENTERVPTLSGSSGGGWRLEPRQGFTFRLDCSNLETDHLVLVIVHNQSFYSLRAAPHMKRTRQRCAKSYKPLPFSFGGGIVANRYTDLLLSYL